MSSYSNAILCSQKSAQLYIEAWLLAYSEGSNLPRLVRIADRAVRGGIVFA